MRWSYLGKLATPFILLFGGACQAAPFYIQVVDSITRRPVPLVEFRTTHQLHFVTDNAGVATIEEPELIGKETYFHISSHGYEFPADGFGYRGARYVVEPGKSVTVDIIRKNRAERLYRVTGAGLFAHSVKAGLRDQEPAESSGVFGCDSVLNALYKGRLFWIWGDTNRASYPLGNFHSTGATSTLDFDLEKGISLQFFDDDHGFVKPLAKMPGEGPTWLTGLAVFPDKDGNPHLTAMFQKVKGFLDLYEIGQCEWNEQSESFDKIKTLDLKKPRPEGHPFEFTDENGAQWMVYADPIPTLKIPLSYEAWKNPESHVKIESDVDFTDVETGEGIQAHRGQICWNEFRKRWVMIFTETAKRKNDDDRAQIGEVFYAESESPFGPWRHCLKVATHNRYTFYNPKQHPEFQKEDGKVIYFEGTYTGTFSRAKTATPRWDYNQVMYQLDVETTADNLQAAQKENQ